MIVTVCVVVHPFASVATTVYTPAGIFARFCVVALFVQAYVYGATPPVTVKLIEPVLFPKQPTFTWVKLELKPLGCVIVVVAVAVHPLASVTVTV